MKRIVNGPSLAGAPTELRIWVVDAFGSPGLSVQQSFGGFELEIFRGSTTNGFAIPEPAPHLAIVALSEHDPERNLAYVRRMRGALDKLPIIGIAVRGSEDLAIAAFRSGCRDYLTLPYAPEELSAAIERCLAASTPRGASSASGAAARMVGASAAMRAIQSCIEKVASVSEHCPHHRRDGRRQGARGGAAAP